MTIHVMSVLAVKGYHYNIGFETKINRLTHSDNNILLSTIARLGIAINFSN